MGGEPTEMLAATILTHSGSIDPWMTILADRFQQKQLCTSAIYLLQTVERQVSSACASLWRFRCLPPTIASMLLGVVCACDRPTMHRLPCADMQYPAKP
eukprot:852206-Amphidinium_carterae.1